MEVLGITASGLTWNRFGLLSTSISWISASADGSFLLTHSPYLGSQVELRVWQWSSDGWTLEGSPVTVPENTRTAFFKCPTTQKIYLITVESHRHSSLPFLTPEMKVLDIVNQTSCTSLKLEVLKATRGEHRRNTMRINLCVREMQVAVATPQTIFVYEVPSLNLVARCSWESLELGRSDILYYGGTFFRGPHIVFPVISNEPSGERWIASWVFEGSSNVYEITPLRGGEHLYAYTGGADLSCDGNMMCIYDIDNIVVFDSISGTVAARLKGSLPGKSLSAGTQLAEEAQVAFATSRSSPLLEDTREIAYGVQRISLKDPVVTQAEQGSHPSTEEIRDPSRFVCAFLAGKSDYIFSVDIGSSRRCSLIHLPTGRLAFNMEEGGSIVDHDRTALSNLLTPLTLPTAL